MATLGKEITITPIDIGTVLEDDDGNAVALTSGSSYNIQNVGGGDLLLSEGAAAPVNGLLWHRFGPREWSLISYSGIPIWAKTGSRDTFAVATEQ